MKTYLHLLASNKSLNNYVAVKLFHTLTLKINDVILREFWGTIYITLKFIYLKNGGK